MSDMLILQPAAASLLPAYYKECIFSNESAQTDLSIANIADVAQSTVMPKSGSTTPEKMRVRLRKILSESRLTKTTLIKTERESRSSFARRVKVNQPELTIQQCAKLAGVSVSTLRNIPQFMVLSAEAKEAISAMPRIIHENPIDYAKRVHKENPFLTYTDLSCISSVDRPILMRMKILKKITSKAFRAQQTTPRETGESNLSYAKRLRVQQPQLNIDEYCSLSGADKYYLRKIAMFTNISSNAIRIGQQIKRLSEETNSKYARRLMKNHPKLSALDCWTLSGAYKSSWRSFMSIFYNYPPERTDNVVEPRPSSPTFEQQLNLALVREIYRDDWSIDDLLSAASKTSD